MVNNLKPNMKTNIGVTDHAVLRAIERNLIKSELLYDRTKANLLGIFCNTVVVGKQVMKISNTDQNTAFYMMPQTKTNIHYIFVYDKNRHIIKTVLSLNDKCLKREFLYK